MNTKQNYNAPNSDLKYSQITAVGLFIVLLLSASLYWPGLYSPFRLDHEFWIGRIGRFGGVVDWATLKLYLFEDAFNLHNRFLGRLTFLIDDQYWPAPPFNFKRTSLLFHLLNGTLFFALSLQLGRLLRLDLPRLYFVALLATAFWLLHPLNHSTVLYASQRVTVVANMFILLALITYLAGRVRLAKQPRLGVLLMSSSLIVLTPLAVLSKETGVFVPIYVLLLEMTLLHDYPRPHSWRRWALICIGLPLLLAAIYGIIRWQSMFVNSYAIREFTLAERLMTEGRVLADYLYRIILPSLKGLGLYHDDFPISSSWLQPPTTLLAWILHMSLISAAIFWRRRLPILAFAILFFYTGHLMESTAIGLEIYFEHRNYTPMLMLCLATAYYLLYPWPRLQAVGPMAAILLFLLLAFMTWSNAKVWGNPRLQARIAVLDHPDSQRANEYWLAILEAEQRFPEAIEILDNLIQKSPNVMAPYLRKGRIFCSTGRDLESHLDRILEVAPITQRDTGVPSTVKNFITVANSNNCLDAHPDFLPQLGQRLLSSKSFIADRKAASTSLSLIINHLITSGREGDAARLIEQTLEVLPTQNLAIALTSIYISLGDRSAAEKALETAKRLRRPNSLPNDRDDRSIERLEKAINQTTR